MWMSQHSIFGIEGKIGYFRLIFGQMLAKNTILNSKTNQKACFFVSFHHIWRYILIEDVSAQYARHHSCVLWNFGGTSANFGLFSTNFWPFRPPYTSKEVKTHISISVKIIYDLNESYLHHLFTQIYNNPRLIIFFY